MNAWQAFGIPTIINACGTNTRLSGGHTRPEVARAMAEAGSATVEMPDLQAGASREIARLTGADAGIVTAGASAAILLGAAACLAGLDPARMNRLPQAGPRNTFLVARSQRNMYDRAVTVAGGRLEEIGIPDRFSGPGVRDAELWEFASAIDDRTAGILWLAQPTAQPALPEFAALARARGVPILVDAAAQLPPLTNLRKFIADGADLVAFSGGKAIGGPQASGVLCGRRDLVSSALAQMLDLDIYREYWRVPPEFAPLADLPGLPHHGIGRSCKAGKEEVLGLLTALRLFAEESDGQRQATWRARLARIDAAGRWAGARVLDRPVPTLELPCADPDALARHLLAHTPPIHVNLGERHRGVVLISPIAMTDAEADAVGAWLTRWNG